MSIADPVRHVPARCFRTARRFANARRGSLIRAGAMPAARWAPVTARRGRPRAVSQSVDALHLGGRAPAGRGARQRRERLAADVTGSEAEERRGEHVDAFGNRPGPQDTRDAALNLSWTLYDFGNRDGRSQSARALLDAAAATASSVSQQTVFAIVQGYYGVVAADAALVAADHRGHDRAQRRGRARCRRAA